MNNLSLEEIVKRSNSERYQYPDVFTDDCGLDIVDPEKGLHAVPSWGYTKSNQVRRATLNITTFKGISADAIHYYGKVKVQGVNMEYDNQPGHSTMSFELERQNPLSCYSYELTLQRPVTQKDKDDDKKAFCEADKRFDWYYIGDLTDRFNSIEDLIEFAKVVFRNRFSGKWEFYVDSPWKSVNGKIDINT